jgi:hypothetical protein
MGVDDRDRTCHSQAAVQRCTIATRSANEQISPCPRRDHGRPLPDGGHRDGGDSKRDDDRYGERRQPRQADSVPRLGRENFCTELGFVDFTKGSREWRAYLASALAGSSSDTGDLSLAASLEQVASLSPQELASRQKEQIDAARLSVGKLKLVNYVAEGTPIPEGFFARYPESAAAGDMTTMATSRYIMGGLSATFKQERSYWCGPATMQAIDWADDATLDSQTLWANLLGTTTAGTGIQAMVSRVNADTTWDSRGSGSYVVLSVSPTNTAAWFMSLHHGNIGTYGIPIVEHVQLLKQYFPYVSHDHGGHYQSGRGYDDTSGTIAIFDPYNEADFEAAGSVTYGYHSVSVLNMFNATLANVNRNVGW